VSFDDWLTQPLATSVFPYLWFSRYDVIPHYVYIERRGFHRLLSLLMGNESCIVIQRQIPLASEAVEHRQQGRVFFVDPRSHKLDDDDMVPGLASRAESVAEHESE